MAEQARLAYLEAMGIQAWSLRTAPPAAGEAGGAEKPGSPPSETIKTEAPATGRAGAAPAEAAAAPAPPPSYTPGAPAPPPPTPAGDWLAAGPSAAGLPAEPPPPETPPACGWDALQAAVQACARCPLHQTRTQTVFGVGDKNARWMVVGEAPGEQEDLQGEPFVGRAGLLLTEMLRAIGLAREEVFIANILKCRPPKNRDPQPDEAAACEGYLKQQLALVRPKIILAVGRVAAQNLLKTSAPVGRLRGRVHDYQGVPLVVVYHPAYLLRSPLEKRAAFDDLRLALHTYRKLTTKP